MGANVTASTGGEVAHRTGLNPVRTGPYLAGFGNILGQELREWFRPRSLLIQAAIWLAIVNGMMAFVLFVVPNLPAQSGEPAMDEDLFVLGLTLFFSMAFQAGAVGAIITSQDEIVGEKQTGTAAWILSKPVTRCAFVLAKLVATGAGLVALVAVLTSVVAYGEVALAAGRTFDVLPYIGGVALISLGLLYFLSLTIMLGTLFSQRGAVIGIALGVLFGGIVLVGMVPQIALVMPVQIHSMAAALAGGGLLPSQWIVTVVSTALSTLVFSAIAIWRFGQEQF